MAAVALSLQIPGPAGSIRSAYTANCRSAENVAGPEEQDPSSATTSYEVPGVIPDITPPAPTVGPVGSRV